MIRLRSLLGLAIATATLWAAEPARLRISYGEKHADLTLPDFAKLRQSEVETPDHERTHRFKGVAIRDLLQLVGAPLGDDLRRPTLSLAVRITGADGLVCAFALAEFDAGFSNRIVIMATHQDGAPLAAEIGPWRVIAPNDRRLARWVRQVVSIEVISLDPKSGAGQADASVHQRFVPR